MGYDIKIPAISETASNVGPNIPYKTQAVKDIKYLKKNYASNFKNASYFTGVPEMILYGFAAIESGSLGPSAVSPAGAVGIMQVTPATAYDTLVRQINNTNDYDGMVLLQTLQKLAPNIIKVKKALVETKKKVAVPNTKPTQYVEVPNFNITKGSDAFSIVPYASSTVLFKTALKNAYFNILVGSIAVAQLLAQSIKSTGQPRMDHVVIKYNAGIGNFARYVTNRGLEKSTVDTTKLKAAFPLAETKAYIVKLLGINGTLDVQKQKLA